MGFELFFFTMAYCGLGGSTSQAGWEEKTLLYHETEGLFCAGRNSFFSFLFWLVATSTL